LQVIGGDEALVEKIRANAAIAAEDKKTWQAVASDKLAETKISIHYQLPTKQRACVYLRCDPITYEVFTVEQHALLPTCTEMGTLLKIGKSYNLNDREKTYKHNGVFVFVAVLSCLCDSKLLEDELRGEFAIQRSDTRLESSVWTS
jgi:hypothetical protein